MRFIQALLRAWQDLLKQPWSALANILVLGIAISIPTVGYGLAMSISKLSFALESKPHINIYLSPELDDPSIDAIFEELDFTEGIDKKTLISKQEALEAFEESSGIDNIRESLTENPLPTTIVITPTNDYLNSDKIQTLIDNIQKIESVDEVQVNQQWLERLHNISQFATTVALVLAILTAVAIIFVLGNTIRLLIANRQEQIIVSKLVGASDRYVRQPFLYLGFLYGLLGGLTAYGIYWIVILLLQEPINQLANSYESHFILYRLTDLDSAVIILSTAILGWISARFSVGKHLKNIKPK